MRIAEIHLFQHTLPVLNGPYRIASSVVSSLETTIVKLVSDTGLVGWGETCPVGPTYQPQHAAGARAAKAAVDIAVHDLMGKHYGTRVADLLGGAVTDRVPSYYASGIGAPDEVARIAAEKAAEGYPRMQVKLGGREVEADIAVIRKVWEAVGTKMRLVADGNRSWTTRDALRLSRE